VFFRKHTLEKARELGVKGYVKNCKDGTVEVFAEGNEQQVDLLVKWCHSGPDKSRVDKVDIHHLPLKNFTEFIITH
jgi:acylphosphatase